MIVAMCTLVRGTAAVHVAVQFVCMLAASVHFAASAPAACKGDIMAWNAGYGACSTYTQGRGNHKYARIPPVPTAPVLLSCAPPSKVSATRTTGAQRTTDGRTSARTDNARCMLCQHTALTHY